MKKIIFIIILVMTGNMFACSDNPYDCWIMGEGFYCWQFKSIDEAKIIYKELKEYAEELKTLKSPLAKRQKYLTNEMAIHIFKCCIEPNIMWETKEFYDKNWDKKDYDMNKHKYWERIRELNKYKKGE